VLSKIKKLFFYWLAIISVLGLFTIPSFLVEAIAQSSRVFLTLEVPVGKHASCRTMHPKSSFPGIAAKQQWLWR
jgi:hypothetical protein